MDFLPGAAGPAEQHPGGVQDPGGSEKLSEPEPLPARGHAPVNVHPDPFGLGSSILDRGHGLSSHSSSAKGRTAPGHSDPLTPNPSPQRGEGRRKRSTIPA